MGVEKPLNLATLLSNCVGLNWSRQVFTPELWITSHTELLQVLPGFNYTHACTIGAPCKEGAGNVLYTLALLKNLFQRPKNPQLFWAQPINPFSPLNFLFCKNEFDWDCHHHNRQTQKLEVVRRIPEDTIEKHSAKEGDHKIDQLGRECLGTLVSKGQGISAIRHCLFSAPGITEGGSKKGTKGTSSLSTAPKPSPQSDALLQGPGFYTDSNVNGAPGDG